MAYITPAWSSGGHALNTNTQMNAEGELIPKEQRKFVVIEGDMKLPQLSCYWRKAL